MPNSTSTLDLSVRSDKPEEACGVFGVYAPEEDVAKLTYFGLYALQHRGQESAGIATFEGNKLHIYKNMGLVSQVFNESILSQLPGESAIGHTRYSTTGSSHVGNAQPIVVETRLGFWKETRGQGDQETRGQGDKGTRGQGDKVTRGQGDKVTR